MSNDPEMPNESDEFESYDGYDPFTSRGSDYDEALVPPGVRYERNLDDRYGRALDFTDLALKTQSRQRQQIEQK
ncbi:MAG: hypothetical protein U0452_00040 [Anaerolineae bacterium]